MTRTQAPAASSRQRLLDAALHEFRSRGYAATTVEDLCRAAGVGKGSFFHHFPGKEALALEAVGHYGAPYFRGFGEGDNEHPIGPDYAHRAAPTYFNGRKTSIYGGSNEIQRNIIAKMVLGL